MIAVTGHAARRQGVATSDRSAMQRFCIELGLVAVAGAAVHLGQRRGVREVFAVQVGVAVGALQRAVNGTGELLLVHEQRNRPPAALGGQRLVTMTRQAVVAGRPGCRTRGYKRHRQ